MKTMTCKQMGGPCDAQISGETAEEIMSNGAQHVTEMKESDAGHAEAWKMMMDMQNDPAAAKTWNDDFAAKFAALPEV